MTWSTTSDVADGLAEATAAHIVARDVVVFVRADDVDAKDRYGRWGFVPVLDRVMLVGADC